jgi:hypothetical protein
MRNLHFIVDFTMPFVWLESTHVMKKIERIEWWCHFYKMKIYCLPVDYSFLGLNLGEHEHSVDTNRNSCQMAWGAAIWLYSAKLQSTSKWIQVDFYFSFQYDFLRLWFVMLRWGGSRVTKWCNDWKMIMIMTAQSFLFCAVCGVSIIYLPF